MTTAGETIPMIDTEGNSRPITSTTVFTTLGIGWAAFLLSLIFNILYYALHPSQVTHGTFQSSAPTKYFLQVDLLNIREKLVVAVTGYEINLDQWTVKGLDFKTENV